MVALLQQDPIAWHQLRRRQGGELAIPPQLHRVGQGALQGRQGALCLVLLHKGKQAIHQHHRPDRPAQLGHVGRKGHRPGHPEQQGHEVQELVGEAQPQGPAAQARETIGSKPLQAPLGFQVA